MKAKNKFNLKPNKMEYVNNENEAVENFLLNTKEGKEILNRCTNSEQLEEEVTGYHSKKGIPNWEFADDYNEGIDWVCFGDLYLDIQSKILTKIK